jgi:hypothetical protein
MMRGVTPRLTGGASALTALTGALFDMKIELIGGPFDGEIMSYHLVGNEFHIPRSMDHSYWEEQPLCSLPKIIRTIYLRGMPKSHDTIRFHFKGWRDV